MYLFFKKCSKAAIECALCCAVSREKVIEHDDGICLLLFLLKNDNENAISVFFENADQLISMNYTSCSSTSNLDGR